jgi:hypothetical protein
MLLEEALSGGANSSSSLGSSKSSSATPGALNVTSSPPLPPSDAALALLSFLRDELPAGGITAEKRFVNLFPLIVDRVFGELIRPPPPSQDNNNNNNNKSSGSPGTTSPGGSTYSSPASSPSSKLASTITSPTSSADETPYYHKYGGWLAFTYAPKPTGSSTPSSSSLSSSQHHQQRSSTSSQLLDNDPIVKLLRAPKRQHPRSTDNNDDDDDSYSQQFQMQQPTLLQVLSSESIHRPQIKFKFPLGGLMLLLQDGLIQDWKKCYLQELDRANNTRNNKNNSGGTFGSSSNSNAIIETTTEVEGMIGKENATRILYHLLLNGPNEQVELKNYFQSGGGNGVLQQKNLNQRMMTSPRAAFVTPMKQQQQQQQQPNRMGFNNNSNNNNNSLNEPNIDLSMLEYYLLVFLRFPFTNKEWEAQYQDQLRRMRYGSGSSTAYGQRVYFHLMSSYMNYYLPHGLYRPDGSSSSGASMLNEGRGVVVVGVQQPLDRTAELFLRLVIELWVEGQVSPPTFSDGIQRYRNGRSAFLSTASSSSSSSSSLLNPTLRDSLELTQPLKGKYDPPPPSQIQIG